MEEVTLSKDTNGYAHLERPFGKDALRGLEMYFIPRTQLLSLVEDYNNMLSLVDTHARHAKNFVNRVEDKIGILE